MGLPGFFRSLANDAARRRAQWLLDQIDDLF